MEVVLIVIAVLTGIAGTLVGIFIGKNKKMNDETKGVLYVDCSDPNKSPGLYLILTVSIDDVASRKHVLLDVNVIQ